MSWLDVASGLAEGIKTGTQSYNQARQIKMEEDALRQRQQREMGMDARQARMDKLTIAEKGFTETPQGEFIRSPQYLEQEKQRQDFEKQKQEGELGLLKARQGLLSQQAREATMPKPEKPSVAQQAVDKGYSKEYVEWQGQGKPMLESGLKNLELVKQQLTKEPGLTGGIAERLPKFAREIVDPESVAAQETVEGEIQKSLKATLGAQFTEKEAQSFMQRGYNPRLPAKENQRRIQQKIDELAEMGRAKDAMAQYYEENGTLKGYKGPRLVMPSGAMPGEEMFAGAKPAQGLIAPNANASPQDIDTQIKALEKELGTRR